MLLMGSGELVSWGEWGQLDPDKGYSMDDKVTLQVHVIADAPHGIR